MDPLTWLSQLDPSSQNLFLGAAGNLVGNLATQAVNDLLRAGRGKVRQRIEGTPEHQALNSVMAQALATTLAALTADPVKIAHFTTLFEKWLAREFVRKELCLLLDPSADTELDLALLTAEFTAAGWSVADLGQAQSFEEIVAELVKHFAHFAAKETIFQEPIKIGYLRLLAGRLDDLVQTGQRTAESLAAIQQLLSRYHPLDLNRIERAYLQGLYDSCNDLPLARDERADPSNQGPRLQRVYVTLALDGQPTLQRVLRRLGFDHHAEVERATSTIQQVLHKANPESTSFLATVRSGRWGAFVRSLLERKIDAPDEQGSEILTSIQRLEQEKLAALADALHVPQDALADALANLTPLEALHEYEQIVILGDPGSGKSTLTQRLAALLAAVGSEDQALLQDLSAYEQREIDNILQTFGRRLLPIRVTLSRWAQQLPTDRPVHADDLLTECARILGEAGDLPDRIKELLLDRAMATPPTVLLLLDGLDEISDDRKRMQVLTAVRLFRTNHRHVPLIVTCRIRPYMAWQATGQVLPLPVFHLAPLDEPRITTFLERWHTELVYARRYEPTQAERAQRQLQRVLSSGYRAELCEMAGTPLLLTMMTRVNYLRGLPDSRAELYERFVDQLLFEWERQKQQLHSETKTLETLLQAGDVHRGSLIRALNELAYEIHGQRQRDDTVDIPASQLRIALERIHPGARGEKAAWAIAVLDLIADRSGLINTVDPTEGAEIYKFSHRTFQEYLAARWLTTGTGEELLAKFKRHVDQEDWAEAWLLGIGHLTDIKAEYANALYVLSETLPATVSDQTMAQRAVLVGDAYLNILGQQRASEVDSKIHLQYMQANLPNRLRETMQHPALPARQRLDAGLLLAELEEGPADVDDLVELNAGRAVGYKFQIGKYPVTNAQFRRFIKDGGYTAEQWWSEEGCQYKEQYGWEQPRDWDNRDLNRSSQPVVGVSWYEAEAYCNWLTARWRTDNTIAETAIVRLPTRAEWEAAARNKHGKEYPWGSDEFDPTHANTEESNLGQTSPVHMYPTGQSRDGVWDLSGNIFEWTNDIREDNKEVAWQKGGCAWLGKDYAKAAAALDSRRWYRNDGSGFRVVVVPISR